MQSPQLQLYNHIFKKLQGYGRPVIDVKDMAQELSYPFFVVNPANERKAIYTADAFNGDMDITIHLWSLADDQGAHDVLYAEANEMLSFMQDLDGYQLMLDELTTNTLIDTSTKQALLHSTLIAQYKVY